MIRPQCAWVRGWYSLVPTHVDEGAQITWSNDPQGTCKTSPLRLPQKYSITDNKEHQLYVLSFILDMIALTRF